MTEHIHIEPGHEQRPAFAAWGLAQDPPIQTASASGWDVPVALYPAVPAELLEGAYVDGYQYGKPTVQPKPDEAPETPSEPPRDPTGDPSLTALDAVMPKTSTRRRAKRSGVDE